MTNKSKMFCVTKTPKGLDQVLSTSATTISDTYSAVINVSDSPCATFDYQMKIPSFWFPINEVENWGHVPFYGTLKVVNEYWKDEKPILIHCHAGANRSPSIALAVMISKGYTIDECESLLNYPNLRLVFLRNIQRKQIPVNIIEFLREADKCPKLSVQMILREMDAEYKNWSQTKNTEQSDWVVEGYRLVYNSETKRYITK